MSNPAEKIPQIEDDLRIKETEKTNLERLVLKLKEYGKIISDILGKEEKEVEGLADKIEKYAAEFKNKEYVPGSSFEHIMNNLSVELCPCAKRAVSANGSDGDRKVVAESFKALNDYIRLLLKFPLFEKEQLKKNNVSSEKNKGLTVAKYIEKRRRELEGETAD